VTAANSDGVWNTTGAAVAVMVHAPFWRRGPVIAGGVLAVFLVAALIVRRRFDRLRREHAQQRAFARELIAAQERERHRISNELHDSLGQDLFVIRARARSVLQADETGSAVAALDDIAAQAARSHDDMKAIAYGLRPYQLDKIGLAKTIEGMLARVAESCGLTVDAEIGPVDRDVGSDAAIHVYRIVQEAVNNVVKHAAATQATVRVTAAGTHVDIVVRDNGRGMPAVEAPAPSGFGLRTLRERALTLGGTMTITSPPGGGTEVRVRLPLERASG
jgi:signal transduction histidine kinase